MTDTHGACGRLAGGSSPTSPTSQLETASVLLASEAECPLKPRVGAQLFASVFPAAYMSEADKVAFAITHLTGRAHLWGAKEWECQTSVCSTFRAFATELRAVLSQLSGEAQKLHPCAVFLKCLTPAERNYNIGNCELLGALEEWRHWLERTKVPFLVWTDPKNLVYIRTMKRLKSRQTSRHPF